MRPGFSGVSCRRTVMQDILDAVDFAGVATWVAAAGVLVIGIAMAFKGIVLGKRAVSKA